MDDTHFTPEQLANRTGTAVVDHQTPIPMKFTSADQLIDPKTIGYRSLGFGEALTIPATPYELRIHHSDLPQCFLDCADTFAAETAQPPASCDLPLQQHLVRVRALLSVLLESRVTVRVRALLSVLVVVSVWVYTLVFVITALWFAHYLLNALHELRVRQSVAAKDKTWLV